MTRRKPPPLAPEGKAIFLFGLLLACRRDDPQETAPPEEETAADSAAVEDSAGDTAAARDPSVAFVVDTSNGRYLYVRLDTREVLHEIDLAKLHPSICGEEICAVFGGWPTVDDATGVDEALLVFTPYGVAGGGPIVEKVRVTPSGDESLWTMDALDFRTNFPDRDDLCAQDLPCTVPDTEDTDVSRRCRLGLPHEVEITAEDDDSVTMWIADTEAPSRALEVTLDKASRCGVVTDVISADTATGWGAMEAVNDIDVVALPDGERAVLLNSLSQTGEGGQASVSLWRAVEGGWTMGWRLPSTESGEHLSAAHNADWITGSDGLNYVVYAHSNGQGRHGLVENFTGADDHKGSIGVARVTASTADYLFDAVIPEGFGFIRDVNLLSDGSFLVVDSGCMSPENLDCTNAPALWQVELPDYTTAVVTGQSGAFTPPPDDQVVLPALPVDRRFEGPLDCDFYTPYAARVIEPDALGTTLQARMERPQRSCDN